MLSSLFVSALMVFFAGFIERDRHDGGLLKSRWVETAVAYIISLVDRPAERAATGSVVR